jgi:D-alanine-D-alanine ligase
VEIDLGGDPNGYQSPEDKMHHPRGKICPARVTPEVAENLRTLACRAFESLGLLDFARVDFRMDDHNKLHILEINSMASLNLSGSFVHAAQALGLDFSGLVNRILEVAAIRYFGPSVQLIDGNNQAIRGGEKSLAIRVRRYLRTHLPSFIISLDKMVAINSFVRDIEGVNILGNHMSRELVDLGFSREVYPQVDVGDILYFTNHTGEQNDILLLGHLDTAYEYENFVPFSEEHGKIVGSGVAESKGGLVVIVAALRSLRFARALRHVRCGVLLTSDDTLGGPFSRKLIEEVSQKSKFVLGTKYCDQAGGIVTSCAGSEEYHVVVANFKSPETGSTSDLIGAACRTAIALRKLNRPKEGTTVSISSIDARKNPGRISDHATIVINITYTDRDRIEKLDKQVHEIVERSSNKRMQTQIRVGTCRPPVSATKASLEFFEKIRSLAESLEVRANKVHREASADICHVPATVPVLGGFGPIGGNRRSPHEFIVRDSLIDRSALLALVIHDSRT